MQFKHRKDSSNDPDATDSDFVYPPDEGLPLDDELVRQIDQLVPELPLNDGQVVESHELDLEADESDLVVTEPYGAATIEEEEVEEQEEVGVEEEEDQVAGYKKKRNNLKRALEVILLNITPGVDNDEDLFICASKKLKAIKEEETSEKKQTTILQFFTPPNSL